MVVLALVLFTADIMAQTAAPASPALSGPVLRRQDRQECITQARQQNIAKRNRAEFVRKCMADRQGARRRKKVNSVRQMSLWVISGHPDPSGSAHPHLAVDL
jgi:hypothetical protein